MRKNICINLKCSERFLKPSARLMTRQDRKWGHSVVAPSPRKSIVRIFIPNGRDVRLLGEGHMVGVLVALVTFVLWSLILNMQRYKLTKVNERTRGVWNCPSPKRISYLVYISKVWEVYNVKLN